MRRVFCFFILIFTLFFIVKLPLDIDGTFCYAEAQGTEQSLEEELGESINEGLNQIDFSELDELSQDNGFEFSEIVKQIISGQFLPDFNNLSDSIVGGIKNGVESLIRPFILIFVLIVVFAIFNALSPNDDGEVRKVVKLIIFFAITIILMQSILKIISSSLNSINFMQKNIEAVFPVILGLISLIGGAQTAAILEPSVVMLSSVISNVFSKVLFSIFSASLVLTLIDSFSSTKRMAGVKGFLSSIFKTIIGLVGGVFTFVLGASGVTAAVSDKLSIRAAKYSIKNYVPYLGGYISDGIALVNLASIIIKNGIGLASIFLLVISVISPLVQIILLILMLKLLSSLASLIGEKEVTDSLFAISNCFKMLIAVVLGVALMFFLSLVFSIKILNVI